MSETKPLKNKEIQSRLQETPIAIIGMSAIFPESKNLDDYWDNIVREVDCITDVPPSRWNLEDYYDPDPLAEDKSYCKRGGFIPDIDFDPLEFGLPPNILEVTDVHQLLSLILAKKVLADGGYAEASDELKENTGVILGVGGGQKLMIPLISRLQYPVWERVLLSSGLSKTDTQKIVEKIKKAYVGWEENSFPGALGNVIAGRIANRLDLGGTNCVVDAACASSLSGIRMAMSELLDHRAEMMITGGVDTDNSPYMFLSFSKTHAFSQGEKSAPFSKDSDGMIMGEGIGMLLLKRLADAERDNDRIYAVIKGMGSSSDGRFKSIYAPRPKGQKLALTRAYKDAGVSPASIEYVEAHGTGTGAGDSAEVSALKAFFEAHDQTKRHIPLGSVKSQIGHTKNAAGAAGITRVALALYHKILPATINIVEPNEELDLENSPFYLNTKVRPWFHHSKEYPRRAGLSAFGFGGTNFHYILEEYDPVPQKAYRRQAVAQTVLLQETSATALLTLCKSTLNALESPAGPNEFASLIATPIPDSISGEKARLGFTTQSREETIELLKLGITKLEKSPEDSSWELKKGVTYRNEGLKAQGKVVALFAGQGSPYLNMGKELVCNFPPLMKNQLHMDELFIEDDLKPLSDTIYPNPTFEKKVQKQQEKQLQLTENAQPAIGVFSAGQYQLLKEAGFKPDYTAGHSFGELTALWAAGVLRDEDYFSLAKARGKAMAAPADDPEFDAGSMLAVMGDVTTLAEEIKPFKGVTIANYNSTSQVVVAGPTDEIKKAQEHLKDKYRTVLLGVSAAFHTELVGHAQKPFAKAIEAVKFKKPNCKVYSNATGKPYPQTPKSIQTILQDHILNAVRFKQEIENIYADGGRIFVEFGPQSILTRLVENILQGKPFLTVAINANARKDSDRQFRDAVVKLRVAGLTLGEIDPFEYVQEKSTKKKNAITLKISGTNYVSEKTKKTFEEALKDGHTIEQNYVPIQPSETNPIPKKAMSKPVQEQQAQPVVQPTAENATYALQSLERGLANFYHHQNETLRIHEQFLNNQSEYSRSFFQIMQQQAQNGTGAIAPEVGQSISQFHSHQGETLRIHEQYLQHQTEYSKYSFELLRQQQTSLTGDRITEIQPITIPTSQSFSLPQPVALPPRPVAAAPIPIPAAQPYVAPPPPNPTPQPAAAPQPQVVAAVAVTPPSVAAPSGLSMELLTKTLLEVVAEKTGYQTDMLELGMDMEADLGIDSIKRVEILNGIQELIPDLPQLNPEDLAELRTLEQIVDHMAENAGTTDSATVSQPSPSAASPSPQTNGVSHEAFIAVLLNVISEKTGYQSDMLELDMDMEADLGIDSIKRVEILNGIQEQLPALPQVNPEELAELRTLKQIAEHMMPNATAASVEIPVISELTSENDGPGLELLTQTLMEVVSEKTGYLADMLELSMDLEADLGIDSIKRVEILNGMQEKLPTLPEVNPEELAELRTLEQIVEKMFASENTGAEQSESVKKKSLSRNTASIAG